MTGLHQKSRRNSLVAYILEGVFSSRLAIIIYDSHCAIENLPAFFRPDHSGDDGLGGFIDVQIDFRVDEFGVQPFLDDPAFVEGINIAFAGPNKEPDSGKDEEHEPVDAGDHEQSCTDDDECECEGDGGFFNFESTPVFFLLLAQTLDNLGGFRRADNFHVQTPLFNDQICLFRPLHYTTKADFLSTVKLDKPKNESAIKFFS